MPRFIAAILAVTICTSPAQAADDAAPVFPLAQALERAHATAPALDAARAGVAAATAARAVAGLRPNPTVNGEYENVGGSRSYKAIEAPTQTLTLGVPLELGGKRSARLAVAEVASRRAAIAGAIAEADLRLSVTKTYIAAVAAERRLAIARDQASVAEEAFQVAHVRVQAGRASPLEEQRAELVRANAGTAAAKAARLVELTRLDLASRIGGTIAGPLDQSWFERIEPAEMKGSDRGAALVLADARSAEALAAAQVRLAESQRVPDVTVTGGARRLPTNGNVAAVVGFSVPLPLFNDGRAAVEQANAERKRATAERAVAETELAQAIAHAETELANQAAAVRNATGPALSAAREAARIARIGYREGKFGQLDLLDAERGLADARNAATEAFAAYHNARAELDRLTTAFGKE